MILDRIFGQGGSRTISTSQQLAEYLQRFGATKSGAAVTHESAMRLAAVFACVRVLAESVGQLPLHFYEQKGRGRELALKHPLYSLLHVAPNEHQTSLEFFEWLVASLAMRGNGYAFINRVGPKRERVAELLPIPPGAVRPEKRGGEVRYFVNEKDGEKAYTPAEILHIPLMTLDGVRGLSPIEQARESIGLGMATEEHGARLFSNGAQPGGGIEVPKGLSDTAYKRLRESWEERHQGAENAHKIAIFEEGAKWAAIGMSSEDAQFLETRKFQRSEIAGIFRVPPHLIGDLERATFGNIEHQSLDFVVRSLMPYLRRIELRIRMQLLTPEERPRFFAKFNEAALLRGDMAARGEFYTKLFNVGALSPNDIRSYEDENPREGGDAYYTPLNMAANGEPPPKGTGDAE